jgi:hypothetical protein
MREALLTDWPPPLPPPMERAPPAPMQPPLLSRGAPLYTVPCACPSVRPGTPCCSSAPGGIGCTRTKQWDQRARQQRRQWAPHSAAWALQRLRWTRMLTRMAARVCHMRGLNTAAATAASDARARRRRAETQSCRRRSERALEKDNHRKQDTIRFKLARQRYGRPCNPSIRLYQCVKTERGLVVKQRVFEQLRV